MTSFIQDVIADIQNKGLDISQLTFILPSKRAGTFLKHTLSQQLEQTIFAPEILAIEEFVETLSSLQTISNTELLFEFYEVYLELTPKAQIETFDKFSKWAQILLQDFNEIDRYLIPSKSIFDYLSAIKALEQHHWSLEEEQTPYVKNYIAFWNKLKSYYTSFGEQLTKNNKGYQGLVYRKATENLEQYIKDANHKTHVFIGFNALNKAEEAIIQELLLNNLALMYWDIDQTFINDKIHDAGLFARSHKTNWRYYQNNSFNWITNHYSSQKNISVIGVPKNIGQIKHIGELLDTLNSRPYKLQNTAVVLGDENLLLPLLNSIPKQVEHINITMGLPLSAIPLASLFEELFKIHKTTSTTLYYKDVINILSHQFVSYLFKNNNTNKASQIIEYIQKNNIVNLSLDQLKKLSGDKSAITCLLFDSWNNSPKRAITNCLELIFHIKESLTLDKLNNLLALEYLYRFNQIFNELNTLNQTYTHIYNISTLYSLYKELLKTETLDFKGEPLRGLQIMGMLESRVLDFETVIISSVNEGILPAGKSNNSFIPFDIKLENGLPTYKEKDAVYTYHFYRLLQRAKNVYILYNTEADVLNGGEKSRFITQLEIENKHKINHYIVSPKVPSIENTPITVLKTRTVLERVKDIAAKGFSPSSLTSYIRNPLDFYYQKVLKIAELETVEETVAANTLGTVVHNCLEDFYKPLTGQLLSLEHIEAMKTKIDQRVSFHFKSEYKEGDITKGKNLIIYEIAKRYLYNFLDAEIKALKQGNVIKICAIEVDNTVVIDIPELDFPIHITGKVDRVDEFNGVTRIIDYKSGRVDQSKVEVINWDELITDYTKYSKSFQVLTYAYSMHKNKQIQLPVEAGIISFKNLSNGFLKFSKKDKPGAYAKKEQLITQETLDNYFKELKKLILEICDKDIPFIEKEV